MREAWQKRLNRINEQAKSETGKQNTTQDLVSSLPWIILVLCVFSIGMFACLRLFGSSIQMELVTSGQVIQFPTVMVLLVVIVALGLAHILTENSLSALLGGLAGYVLSQGIGRAATKAAQDAKASSLTISASSLKFPDTSVGSTSASQIITITNNGSASRNPLLTLTGDFSESNDLGGSLAPGASAKISVLFQPKAAGDRLGSLTVNDELGVQIVKLSGKAV